jgi:hypothetical protein
MSGFAGKNGKTFCKNCKEEKPISEFKMKVGYRKICKECYLKVLKEAQNKWRNKV